jgi:hypothetical protein
MTYYEGQIIIAADSHHRDDPSYTGRRPHIILQIHGDQLYIAELSHTRQGEWKTDELATSRHTWSYLALTDFRTGEWRPAWISASQTDGYYRQLSESTREAALDIAAKTYRRCHR